MRSRLALVAVAAVLTVAVVALSLRYVDPFPPRRIVLATGQAGGTYEAVGREYQRRLGREGLRVELLSSAGSIENLQRLLGGQADVAFVQGGTYPLVPDPEARLRGMAALYREPLWIFYRGQPLTDGLASLAGRRVAIGAPGSGTEAVARALLGELGLPAAGDNVLSLPSVEARRRLEEGAVDAAFFVSSYRDDNVAALLRRPDVRLLGFRRDVAFARNFRYLSPVRLSEGMLDLKDDLPREELTVMAPAALLVCRATLHPRVVEQLLSVARDVHAAGSLIDAPRRFPTREGVDVPLHEAADSFLQRGESFMSRVLPYWALRWVVQLRLVLLPLVAVWVPLFKILPWLIRWRGNRILERHYAVLRDLEGAIAGAAGPEALRDGIARLEALRGQIEALARRLPLQHQRDVYHCRVHVSLVLAEARDRLRRLERAAAV
ncbi:MAG TPA: TAXI family TRAP transporter solute-binding subunit [Methylomirabilota bacterium]|nr:TAXI family TRAP transporter solute-binding subunit [Methylomirabilota bacterium]